MSNVWTFQSRAAARHNLFVRTIKELIWIHRKDVILVAIGPRGSGKSSIVYDISRKIDPNFTLQRNVYYDVDAELEFVTTPPYPPRGTAPIYDDLATALDAKKWMDDFNRAVARTSQFAGSWGYLTSYIAPGIRDILTDIRALADFIILTEEEPEYAGYYRVRKGRISPNLTHPAIWYPYARRGIKTASGTFPVTFDACYAPRMSDDEYRIYEEYKESFTRPAARKQAKQVRKRKMKNEGIREIDSEKGIAYY